MLNLSKEKLLMIIALVLAGVSLTVFIVLGLQVIKLKQDLTFQSFPALTPAPQIITTPTSNQLIPTIKAEISCNEECIKQGYASGTCKVEEFQLACSKDETDIGIAFCGSEVAFKCCCLKKTTPAACQTDADCPPIACVQGCPVEGPCPPCPQYKCVNGICQKAK